MGKISTLSLINKLLVVVHAIIPTQAMAHTGHDHHHWLSGFYHVSALLILVAGLSALLYCILTRVNANKIKRKKLTEDR